MDMAAGQKARFSNRPVLIGSKINYLSKSRRQSGSGMHEELGQVTSIGSGVGRID
jgi:hypothetical protein